MAPAFIAVDTLEEAWFGALTRVVEEGELEGTRLGPSLEVRPATLIIKQPRQRFVLSRIYNLAFAYAEFLWIMRGEESLSFVQFFNPRMQRFSDDGRTLHGAYGFRLRTAHGFDQLLAAYEALSKAPDSRQVVLDIWHPARDFPQDGPASKDVACSIVDHLLVRRGALEWTHMMRSNDLVWGLPYDVLVFTCMQEVLAGWLSLDIGPYVHQVGVIQVYEQHFDYARKLVAKRSPLTVQRSEDDLRLPLRDFTEVLNELWERLQAMIAAVSPEAVRSIFRGLHLPQAYQNIAAVLTAEILYRKGAPEEVLGEVLAQSSNRLQHHVMAQWLLHRLESDPGRRGEGRPAR